MGTRPSFVRGIRHKGPMMQNFHYDDVIMTTMASQITSLTIVYSTVYSDADQIKHQSSASLAFVWEIHRVPVNFPHKGPVTRKMFPFDDVIMWWFHWCTSVQSVKQTLELSVMWGTMTLMWSPCIFDSYRAVTATTPVEYQCLFRTSLQILGSHWLMLLNDNRYEKDRPSSV